MNSRASSNQDQTLALPQLESALADTCAQLTVARREAADAKRHAQQSLGDALDEKDAFLVELKALNRQMFASREESNAKLSAFEARMAEDHMELARVRGSLDDSQSQNEQTRLELAAARQSITTLTAALSAADRRHAEVSNALELARADAETSKQMAAQCNEDVDSMRRQVKSFQAMISTMLIPSQPPQQQHPLHSETHKRCDNAQTDCVSSDASVDEPCKVGSESDQLYASTISAGSEIFTPPASTHNIESLLASIQTAIEASFGAQSERAAAAAACARHSAELVALRKRNSYVEQQIQTELADKMELIAQTRAAEDHAALCAAAKEAADASAAQCAAALKAATSELAELKDVVAKVAGDRSTLLRRSVDAEAALDDTREMLSVVQSRASELQAFADQCKREVEILKCAQQQAASHAALSATQSPHFTSAATAPSNIPPSSLDSNPPCDSLIAAVAALPPASISSASAAAPRISSHPPSDSQARTLTAPTAGGRVLPASLLADFADDDDDDDDDDHSSGGQ